MPRALFAAPRTFTHSSVAHVLLAPKPMRSSFLSLALGVALLAFFPACGGSTSDDGAATPDTAVAPDGATADAIGDATTTDAAADTQIDSPADTSSESGDARSCGDNLCAADEVCVHGLYRGLDGDCIAMPDAGPCPDGWKRISGCHGPNPGCVPPACTPFDACSVPPASCVTAESCSCFTTDPCAPMGHCVDFAGGHLHCVCG
jgi:hypothetical protein